MNGIHLIDRARSAIGQGIAYGLGRGGYYVDDALPCGRPCASSPTPRAVGGPAVRYGATAAASWPG